MNEVASPPESKNVEKRTKSRIRAGRDPRMSRWQGALESMLTDLEDRLTRGEIITPETLNPKDHAHFQRLQLALDLPPFIYAVYLPPGPADKLNPSEIVKTLERSSGDSRKVVVTRVGDFSRILVAEVSPAKPGIDILEDANLLGSHNYSDAEECINDLSKIIWIHFRHKEQWTEPDFIQYTESWFYRSAIRKLTRLPVTANFSYLHHPVLINADIVTAVFKLLKAALDRFCADPDRTVRMANDINLYNPGTVRISREGLARKDPQEMESLHTYIEDKLLGLLKFLKRCGVVNFQGFSTADQRRFKRLFARTAEESYQSVLARME
jgi:hypothetical protein